MRQLVTSLLLLGSIALQAQTNSIKATNEMTAREIIDKNAYIEFTAGEKIGFKFPFVVTESAFITLCSDSIANPSIIEWNNAISKLFECSKMRAAHYRLYKTLSLDNEKRLVTTAKTASDLNMSEKLFKRFMKEIESRNKTLTRVKADYESKGQEIFFDIDKHLETFMEEPIDYSNVELKDNGLTAQEMVDKNIFIGYTVNELNAKASQNRLHTEHPAWRAARYRFYKNVKENEQGLYYWDIKSGKELNISEDLFNHFTKDLNWVNEGIKRDMENGDSHISKPKFDEQYLNRLLDDNFSKYYLSTKDRIKYYPIHNSVTAR